MQRRRAACPAAAPPPENRVSLQERARRWIHSKHMVPATAVVSLLESTVLPIPLEVLLVPLMQARRDKLWLLAGAALLGCVLGAAGGYWIGAVLMDTVGAQVVGWMDQEEAMEDLKAGFNENGFLYVLWISLSPVPFQVAMLAAGAAGYSLWKFLLAAFISRAIRYFGLALVVWWLGDRAEAFIRRHRWPVAIATLVAAAAAVAWKLST